MITFNPANLKDPVATAPLYIQDIHTGIDGTHNATNTDGRSAIMSDKIRIRQTDAAYLSITFSALSYLNMSAPQYEYSSQAEDANPSRKSQTRIPSFSQI